MSKRRHGLLSDEAIDLLIETARDDYLGVLDRNLDDAADLARIYARCGQEPPPAPEPEPDTQLAAVCDRIAMLESALTAAMDAWLGGMYVMTARRYLFELRTGLAAHRLTGQESRRLLGGAEHNLREASRILGAQASTGNAPDLTQDLREQLATIGTAVMRLFDESGDSVLVPASV